VELLSVVAAVRAAQAPRLPLQCPRCGKIAATPRDYGFEASDAAAMAAKATAAQSAIENAATYKTLTQSKVEPAQAALQDAIHQQAGFRPNVAGEELAITHLGSTGCQPVAVGRWPAARVPYAVHFPSGVRGKLPRTTGQRPVLPSSRNYNPTRSRRSRPASTGVG